jgi:RNA polymerase sigma-70 factor (ECF subfamily)
MKLGVVAVTLESIPHEKRNDLSLLLGHPGIAMIVSKSKADRRPIPPIAAYDVPSFQTIYKQYVDFIWSSAGYLGAGSDIIDDVVQDVFIVIHSKLATLQRPEAMRSWIYGIVRRTLSEYRRSRRMRDSVGASLGAEPRSSQTSPLDIVERRADLELIENLLAKLDGPKREVFVMVEILEMTVPEVVQALEIPMNTAYSRLRLARQTFEAGLARHEAREQKGR